MKKSDKRAHQDLSAVSEKIAEAKMLIDMAAPGAERALITIHFVKEGRIRHYFYAGDFLTNDWGKCIIATAVEARKAEMLAQSGASKV